MLPLPPPSTASNPAIERATRSLTHVSTSSWTYTSIFQATDVGVADFLKFCPWCTHLIVTNDDNGYHPRFLERVFADRGWDMLTTDFTTDGKITPAAWERGHVDLGEKSARGWFRRVQ